MHPSNICNPSYLRSSYNDGGFNNAVPKFLKDPSANFYDIFQPLIGEDEEADDFEVTDPGRVLLVQERARDVARRLRAVEAPLTTMKVSNFHRPAMSDIDAIEWTESEMAKAKGKDDAWAFSSREGFFDPKGVQIHAVTFSPSGEVILVYKAETDGTPWTDTYADSAEILAEEFCQTLLDLIGQDGGARIIWSG